MGIEIVVGLAILVALVFLATIDMAFSHLSDVGLRRLSADSEDTQNVRSAGFLREILENRPRFRFALSSTIQILLISFTVVAMLISMRFTDGRGELVLLALMIALLATVVFRQILPRLLVRNSPEQKLLFLL